MHRLMQGFKRSTFRWDDATIYYCEFKRHKLNFKFKLQKLLASLLGPQEGLLSKILPNARFFKVALLWQYDQKCIWKNENNKKAQTRLIEQKGYFDYLMTISSLSSESHPLTGYSSPGRPFVSALPWRPPEWCTTVRMSRGFCVQL